MCVCVCVFYFSHQSNCGQIHTVSVFSVSTDIKVDAVSPNELTRFEENKKNMDRYLAPYPYERCVWTDENQGIGDDIKMCSPCAVSVNDCESRVQFCTKSPLIMQFGRTKMINKQTC